MYHHHKSFMIMAICAASLACAVEEAEDGALARDALVEEADAQVSLALTEHAVCMAEPEAVCEATHAELAVALEHLEELRDGEPVFRAKATVECDSGKVVSCSGYSCFTEEGVACVCHVTGGGLSIGVCWESIE